MGAAGDDSAADHRVAPARDALALDREGHELLRGPFGTRGRDRLRPDEARLLLAAPAEAGLDRVAVLGQVVAVEVKAGLEAQRVARGQAGRLGAGGDQRVPEAGRVLGVAQQLDAVLARVARPAHQDRHAGDAALALVHAGRQLAVGHGGDQLARLGPLGGDHGEVGCAVDDVDVEALGVLCHPRQVALVVGGVGDGEEVAVGEAVGEQVVEHAAVLAAQQRVLGAALGDPAHVVGEHALEELERLRPARLDLAHVRHVEDAGALAHGQVLLPYAGILNGHLPA